MCVYVCMYVCASHLCVQVCGIGFLYVNEKEAFHNNAMTKNVRGHICYLYV